MCPCDLAPYYSDYSSKDLEEALIDKGQEKI